MKRMILSAVLLSCWSAASASTVFFQSKSAFDTGVPGNVSLTGPLTELGNVGDTTTIGDVTLKANDDIYVEDRWSSDPLLDIAIAISGPEDLGITIDIQRADAFGFYFLEPTLDDVLEDGCNATCVDSEFTIQLFDGLTFIEQFMFDPFAQDQAIFFGWKTMTPFNRISITESTGGIDNEFYGEMYARVVPLPGAVWLFGSALIGLFGLQRRIRNPRAA